MSSDSFNDQLESLSRRAIKSRDLIQDDLQLTTRPFPGGGAIWIASYGVCSRKPAKMTALSEELAIRAETS